MAERPALPFRVLQRSLRAASRAGSAVLDRVLRSSADPEPLANARPSDSRQSAQGVSVRLEGAEGVREIRIQPGVTILEAARAADIELRSYCGGNCSCGTCRVEIVEGAKNLSRMEGMEEFALSSEHREKGRLACQAQILGAVRVRIPDFF